MIRLDNLQIHKSFDPDNLLWVVGVSAVFNGTRLYTKSAITDEIYNRIEQDAEFREVYFGGLKDCLVGEAQRLQNAGRPIRRGLTNAEWIDILQQRNEVAAEELAQILRREFRPLDLLRLGKIERIDWKAEGF